VFGTCIMTLLKLIWLVALSTTNRDNTMLIKILFILIGG
jgi:hypothetical protein